MSDAIKNSRTGSHSRRPLARLAAIVMVLALLVGVTSTGTAQAHPRRSGSATAVAVLGWNAITYRVFGERAYPPPVQGLLGGYVAAAVFGAVNTIEGGYEPYVRQARAARAHRSTLPSPPPPTTSWWLSGRQQLSWTPTSRPGSRR